VEPAGAGRPILPSRTVGGATRLQLRLTRVSIAGSAGAAALSLPVSARVAVPAAWSAGPRVCLGDRGASAKSKAQTDAAIGSGTLEQPLPTSSRSQQGLGDKG
jgi:hypothetical protein